MEPPFLVNLFRRRESHAWIKVFYTLPLEVHILRGQLCILFLVHFASHFCSFLIDVSIDPIAGHTAVESLR